MLWGGGEASPAPVFSFRRGDGWPCHAFVTEAATEECGCSVGEEELARGCFARGADLGVDRCSVEMTAIGDSFSRSRVDHD